MGYKKDKQKALEEGVIGEKMVREYLLTEGYTIMEKNWSPSPTSKLELDIIAQKDMHVAFIEVKTRSGATADPFEAITPKKIANICKAADSFLSQQEYMYEYRFDVAAVTFPKDGDPVLEYVKDAFLPPLGNK